MTDTAKDESKYIAEGWGVQGGKEVAGRDHRHT